MLMFGGSITGLAVRESLTNELPRRRFLRTDPVYVEEIGRVVHCTFIEGYLASLSAVEILKDVGYKVLVDGELNLLVKKYPHVLPAVILNALGSHWTEDERKLVRRYYPRDGTFVEAIGAFDEDWSFGQWLSCRIVAPPGEK